MPLSPASAEPATETVDPLVAQATRKIADVINDFKRALNKRKGTWSDATGAVELPLQSQTFEITIVPDEDGKEYPITVQAKLKTPNATNADTNTPPSHTPLVTYKPTRRTSDTDLEKDSVS